MHVNHKQLVEALRLCKIFAGKPTSKLPIFAVAELRLTDAGDLGLRRRTGDCEIVVALTPSVQRGPRQTIVVPVDAALKALKAVKADAAGNVEISPRTPGGVNVGPLAVDTIIRPEDLPEAHPAKVVTEDVPSAFFDMLSAVAPAMCQDVTRISLGGVWFDEHEHLVATDGHRLHAANSFAPHVEDTLDVAKGVDRPQPFIPACIVETILALKKPGSPRLGFDRRLLPKRLPDELQREAVDGAFRAQCIDGRLHVTLRWSDDNGCRPDWRAAIGNVKANVQVALSAFELREHLSLCAAHLDGARHKATTLRFERQTASAPARFTLRATNFDGVELLRTPSCTWTVEGCDDQAQFEVALDVSYMLAALDVLGDGQITIACPFAELEESTRKYRPDNTPRYVCESPVVIAGAHPGRTTFVMPCRL